MIKIAENPWSNHTDYKSFVHCLAFFIFWISRNPDAAPVYNHSYGQFYNRQQPAPDPVNTLRPRQNGCHFPDDIFKGIFLNENVWISTKVSLKFVPKGLINNILALDQILAWRHPGNKPLSEPMMVCLRTHICVTRPQWVKGDYWICQTTSN